MRTSSETAVGRVAPRGRLVSASWFGIGLTTASAAGVASSGTGLPTSFLGEIAAVSLAFSLPALIAGTYLAIKRLLSGHGLKGALAVSALTLCASFGWPLFDARPELLTRWAGS